MTHRIPLIELSNTLLQFSDKSVRDLAWAVGSVTISPLAGVADPLLIPDSFWSAQFREYEPFLLELDRDPRSLHDFLKSNTKSGKIGERFELLLLFWLRSRPSFEVLGQGVQVSRGRNTIGEFDFLLRSPQGVFHWEVGAKFYLGIPGEDSFEWRGFDPNDTLSTKRETIRTKQLALSLQEESISLLKEEGIFSLECRYSLKGAVFLPIARFQNDALLNIKGEGGKQIRPSGWWCYWSEFPSLSFEGIDRLAIVDRARWLSPEHYLEEQDSLKIPEFLRKFASLPIKNRYSFLLSGLKRDRSGRLREVTRGAVVSSMM
ncbi:MAG: DUF1853 family protein [Bdellovibrionales bacterium]|nr:DUF1853 family protein [Bdellovibrionales bacterium]